MPKQASQPDPILTRTAGETKIDIYAGEGVASVPTTGGQDFESYSHLQVTVTPMTAIPDGFRVYFNDDTARCLSRPVLDDLVAAMGAE